MQICTVVQLKTSQAEHDALVKTLRACNAVCDTVCQIAFETETFHQYDLHHKTYHPIKAESGLHSNHVVRAIAKVADAYKLDRETLRTFRPLGAIELDDKLISWKVEAQVVSINTICGRLHLKFRCSAAQKDLLRGKLGQADLMLKDGKFYLSVAVKIAEAALFEPKGAIGVDLGIVNVATDVGAGRSPNAPEGSEGNQHTGEGVKQVRRKYRRLRQGLQPKKTRSARKKLQKVRKRESRFVRNENHRIAKTLVLLARDRQKALGIENLTGIRDRANGLNRAMRTELNQWAFNQLKQFVAYKAKRMGVTVIEVDPRYSSQTCSVCGHCERANRKSQEKFECLQCGLKRNADFNAALNLKARAEACQPAYGSVDERTLKDRDKPAPLGVGR